MKTDLGIYPEPPLPSLPPAGGKIIDPIFSTEIIRVTDERDGSNLGTYYSYWPTFNSDNTRLLIRADANAIICNFDPANFAIGTKEPIPSIPGVGNPTFEGASWSGTDPSILFISANASLYAYHADTKQYELLADIQTAVPGEYIKQPSWSEDGNRVGFTRKRYSDYAEPGYAVYDRTLKRLVLNQTVPKLDEVSISQSGRYLLAKLDQGVDVIESVVHDLDTGTSTPLIDDKDAAPGHGDAGQNIYVGYDNFANRIVLHDLSNPKPWKTLFQFDKWGMGMGHVSMRSRNEAWALVSFSGVTVSQVFANEVIQIATDGSQNVRRLFHHRSVEKAYYDSPRPNISRDGKLVAFTSNWGGQGRTDLFIGKIEASTPVPTPTPTPTPTPIPTPDPSAPAIGELKKGVSWPTTESRQDIEAKKWRAQGWYWFKNESGTKATFVYTGVKLLI